MLKGDNFCRLPGFYSLRNNLIFGPTRDIPRKNIFMPEQWSNFFVMVGSGAAALAGLIFVAMSINHEIIIRNATHKNRAINMLSGFTAIFMASGFALIGKQSAGMLGLEWVFLWLIATVIFAIPAPIRLTYLGITQVQAALVEAGESFGSTRWQLLTRVKLPAAMPTIMAGVNQCIMLCLSMVVIAGLVGAGGLGNVVVKALGQVRMQLGVEGGLAIVIVAIILDRTMKQRVRRRR